MFERKPFFQANLRFHGKQWGRDARNDAKNRSNPQGHRRLAWQSVEYYGYVFLKKNIKGLLFRNMRILGQGWICENILFVSTGDSWWESVGFPATPATLLESFQWRFRGCGAVFPWNLRTPKMLEKKTPHHFHLTLPETNSLPLKIDPWKRRFLLETTIFRGYVSFKGGYPFGSQPVFFLNPPWTPRDENYLGDSLFFRWGSQRDLQWPVTGFRTSTCQLLISENVGGWKDLGGQRKVTWTRCEKMGVGKGRYTR